MDKVQALRIYKAVALEGSFAAAARALAISRPSVSNAVRQLEDDLGVQLIARTTRALRLTDAGRRYLERIGVVLNELDQAEGDLRGTGGVRCRRLRVTAPCSFGASYVAPMTADFLHRHADMQVDLHLTDEAVDLLKSPTDIALRLASWRDNQTTKVHPVAQIRRILVASKRYLRRSGQVKELRDLRRHECLIDARNDSGSCWRFAQADSNEIRVQGSLRADSLSALRTAALNGLGIAALPIYLVAEDLEADRLTRVLSGYELEPQTLFAEFPPGGSKSPLAALFLDHVIAGIGSPPQWERSLESDRPRLAG
jgi:DNA-binding transcriptional LysR family regulator